MSLHTIRFTALSLALCAVALAGAAPPERLTSRPRPAAAAVAALAVGDELRTEAGQRRRVRLPDGSVLYANHDTTLKLNAARRVTLTAGEAFVEVAPGEAFVMSTPKREVTATGTRFAVRADRNGTSVFVVRGKVNVSG